MADKKKGGGTDPNKIDRRLASTSQMTTRDQQDARTVASLRKRANVQVGKPKRLKRVESMRVASTVGSGLGGIGGTIDSLGGNYYSPELSTDFLELPQSLHEAWNYYRFFYDSEPFVGQAIDLHTELPLSKVRIGVPKAKDRDMAMAATRFCEDWARRIGLLHRLIAIVHDYHLIGEVNVFAEDDNPEMPMEVQHYKYRELTSEGELVDEWRKREDADERAVAWLKKNYRGWTALRVLPPEQVHMESFPFTDEKLMELIPDQKSKSIVSAADSGDPRARRIADSMPRDVVEAIRDGRNIPLNTDPMAGSFVHYMANKKSDYEPRGHSILQRCLLPGSMVTVQRHGIVQQIPVENVDVSTDLLLTHKGSFRVAKKASRPVSETIAVVELEGIQQPLSLTADHRVLQVMDGVESWTEAGSLQEGDLLRESHVVPRIGCIRRFSLADWWTGRTLILKRRRNEAPRKAQVVEASVDEEGGLHVTFEYGQDDIGRVRALQGMAHLVSWLKSLKDPTEASYKAVQGITGLSRGQLQNCISILRRERNLKVRNEPSSTGWKGIQNTVVWSPLPMDTEIPGLFSSRTEYSQVSEIVVDKDFCYLLGTWFGDGCVWKNKGSFLNTLSLSWSISRTNHKLREHVQDLLGKSFGSENVVLGNLMGGASSTRNVRLKDPLLARWFLEEFGGNAKEKALPSWFFNLSDEHMLAFLRGLLDTDGSLSVQSNRVLLSIELSNPVLIHQIHLLCNRIGFHTQIGKYSRQPVSWTREWETQSGRRSKTYEYGKREYWRLTCNRWEDVSRWAEGTLKGASLPNRDHHSSWDSRFQKGWLTRRVRRVHRVPYTGLVYSFDVEQDESLVVNQVCVHNCIRTLVFFDKLRQAQAMISSRHMTPVRIVYAEDMDAADVDNLRDQVDMAIQDPDFSIIANFQITWEEMGADQRLLDLSSEYDLVSRMLYAGLGVTESLLTGEGAYSGDRINLEVINVRYMLLREILQDFVEEYLFRPMCARMGFVEQDEDGNDIIIYPKLSFTRLALRDNQDTFDALFNLYQKGSLDIDVILELLNIDPVSTREKLERDLWTINDPNFNEVLRGVYGEAGRKLAEASDVMERIAKNLKLKYEEPEEEGGSRF